LEGDISSNLGRKENERHQAQKGGGVREKSEYCSGPGKKNIAVRTGKSQGTWEKKGDPSGTRKNNRGNGKPVQRQWYLKLPGKRVDCVIGGNSLIRKVSRGGPDDEKKKLHGKRGRLRNRLTKKWITSTRPQWQRKDEIAPVGWELSVISQQVRVKEKGVAPLNEIFGPYQRQGGGSLKILRNRRQIEWTELANPESVGGLRTVEGEVNGLSGRCKADKPQEEGVLRACIKKKGD